jgi:uncharacterized membrane protein
MAVFAYLAGLMALIFWISEFRPLRKIFDITPPVLYAYFLPTVSTALLMAVLGYNRGTYVGLGCAWLLGQMARAVGG